MKNEWKTVFLLHTLTITISIFGALSTALFFTISTAVFMFRFQNGLMQVYVLSFFPLTHFIFVAFDNKFFWLIKTLKHWSYVLRNKQWLDDCCIRWINKISLSYFSTILNSLFARNPRDTKWKHWYKWITCMCARTFDDYICAGVCTDVVTQKTCSLNNTEYYFDVFILHLLE